MAINYGTAGNIPIAVNQFNEGKLMNVRKVIKRQPLSSVVFEDMLNKTQGGYEVTWIERDEFPKQAVIEIEGFEVAATQKDRASEWVYHKLVWVYDLFAA